MDEVVHAFTFEELGRIAIAHIDKRCRGSEVEGRKAGGRRTEDEVDICCVDQRVLRTSTCDVLRAENHLHEAWHGAYVSVASDLPT